MSRKMSTAAERKIITTNQGYWDGAADRERQQIAPWYRGAHKTYGHYDANYAEGYNLGLFGGEPPPYAKA